MASHVKNSKKHARHDQFNLTSTQETTCGYLNLSWPSPDLLRTFHNLFSTRIPTTSRRIDPDLFYTDDTFHWIIFSFYVWRGTTLACTHQILNTSRGLKCVDTSFNPSRDVLCLVLLINFACVGDLCPSSSRETCIMYSKPWHVAHSVTRYACGRRGLLFFLFAKSIIETAGMGTMAVVWV